MLPRILNGKCTLWVKKESLPFSTPISLRFLPGSKSNRNMQATPVGHEKLNTSSGKNSLVSKETGCRLSSDILSYQKIRVRSATYLVKSSKGHGSFQRTYRSVQRWERIVCCQVQSCRCSLINIKDSRDN